MHQYIALIHKDSDSDFGVGFPDFPGCFSAGEDLDEARAMAEEALDLHIEGMVAEGIPVPEPSSLEEVMADRENRNAVAVLVPGPTVKSRVVRVNVTLPEVLLKRIDAAADNRSAFLAEAARKALREKVA
jgi:predicted RNase H-like HicB family nuclease